MAAVERSTRLLPTVAACLDATFRSVPTYCLTDNEKTVTVELREACEDFMAEVNGRMHRETRRIPAELPAEERLQPQPGARSAVHRRVGETRRVGKDSTISVESVRYSVPHQLVDERVWVRFHGDELIVTAMAAGSAVEVARHPRSMPGSPRIADERYPDSPRGERTPKPTNPSEAQFLAIGPGAVAWLVEAAATGVRRIRAKMADAVAPAKLYGTADVDRALGTAATVERGRPAVDPGPPGRARPRRADPPQRDP